MILNLDHVVRLNIFSLLNAVEAKGRWESWCVCALQKKLDLDAEERTIIGWRKERTEPVFDEDGKMKEPPRDYVLWNRLSTLPLIEYEMDEDEIDLICKALENAVIVQARDGEWYNPLNEQLPKPKKAMPLPQNGMVPVGAASGR
jgi:hypothetical protein